jgi:hypothetical protein
MITKFTFGKDHERYHNYNLTLERELPYYEGWVEVISETYEEARFLMFTTFGSNWSQAYNADKKLNMPLGCLAVISDTGIEFPNSKSRYSTNGDKITKAPNVFDPI